MRKQTPETIIQMELPDNNLLLINKERGVTSFQEINRIRKELGVSKTGHAGTLDKDAEGLLLVCTGKATKLLKFLVGLDKTYIAQIHLGIQTTTDDAEGEVYAKSDSSNFSLDVIKHHLEKYCGKIMQRPPNYSAVHINGKRAYQIAKNGENPEIKAREVTIHNIKIIDFASPILTLEISCSSGTYIRSLARDIGIDTGYFAHICGLKRTKIGTFSLKDAFSFEEIKNKTFKAYSPEIIVSNIPTLELKEEFVNYPCCGKPIFFNMLKSCPKNSGYYKLINNDKLTAILIYNGNKLQYDLVYNTENVRIQS